MAATPLLKMISPLPRWLERIAFQSRRAEESLLCPPTPSLIGVDEVGRGALAGPVVAAAAWVALENFPQEYHEHLRDSKRLPSSMRRTLAKVIHHHGTVALGIASPAEIDQHNILKATMMAMQRAVSRLLNKMPKDTQPFILVDGNKTPSWHYPSSSIVKGDDQCPSIAAAAICAKVTRDRLMRIAARKFPAYGWQQNAGYGTAHHRNAINAFGRCAYHRRTFILKSERN